MPSDVPQAINRQDRPVAIVSTSIPPAPTGQASVIGRLLTRRPAARVVLFSDMLDLNGEAPKPLDSVQIIRLPSAAWAGRRTFLERASRRYGEYSIFRRLVSARAESIADHLVKDQPSVIIGCSGSPYDLPAAFAASRRLGTDFIGYLFDDPVVQWPDRYLRLILRAHERIWARHSRCILVPNESLGAAMRSRCGRSCSIVHNIVDDAAFLRRPGPANDKGRGECRIVYTGSVYNAQADAFHTLAKALDSHGGRFELHVYTAQTAARLAQLGIEGRYVFRHDHMSWPEIGAVQQQADALFLPLAFDPKMRRVLRTASPGKMGEYLASGRPILVHAPSDTFVSRFFRENDCGIVVDRPDPGTMAEHLPRLIGPEAVRRTANAERLAEQFRPAVGRQQFWQAVLGDRAECGT